MKNITLIDYYKLQIEDLQNAEFFELEEFSYTFYIVTQSHKVLGIKVDPKNPNEKQQVFEFQIDDEDLESDDKVLDMKYILELESLVIVSKNGMILQLNVQNKEIEPVGMIDGGVLGAQWSPNQEQLIIASGTSNLISLNTGFDILNEVPIDEEGNQVLDDQPVYISWKNDAKYFMTNFALNGGRKVLTRDSELNMSRSAAKSDPDGGIVQSVAEKAVENLQGIHHWQPNANFIVGWDKQPLKDHAGKFSTRVIFWEKNGLRHLDFVLPSFQASSLKNESDLTVIQIQFNRDSDILAVTIREQEKEYVLIYNRSNYRWYLKKVFEAQEGQNIQQVFWCSTSVCRLFVLYQSNYIEILDINLSHSLNSQDTALKGSLALGLSIDNQVVLANLFARNIIPPPMSNFELACSQYIDAFSFGHQFVFAITGKNFHLFKLSKDMGLKSLQCENNLIKNTERVRAVQYNENKGILTGLRNKNEIFQINFQQKDGQLQIVDSHFNQFQESSEQIISSCGSSYFFRNYVKSCGVKPEDKQSKEESQPIINLNKKNDDDFNFDESGKGVQKGFFSFGNQQDNDNFGQNDDGEFKDHVYFQTQGGQLFRYYYHDQSLERKTVLPSPVFKLIVTDIEGEEKILGLSQNLKLIHDNKVVCPECTSFYVFKNFLLFTVKSQQLYEAMYVLDFKDPKSALHDLDANIYHKLPKQNSGEDFIIRNIERGCRIVSITNQLKLVYQATRGNLEGMYPRILVLKRVKELIYQNKYLKAFEMCRTNKLDINLIFDIDPVSFIKNSADILDQIQNTDYLNFFIQSLNNSLSPELSYSLTLEEQKKVVQYYNTEVNKLGNCKINLVCDLILRDLSKKESQTYLYTIMTTHIKKEPSELEIVLNKIKDMKDSENDQEEEIVPPHLNKETNQKYKPSRTITARKVLEFVCWLANANKMYEIALLTYDLDLVAMVAEFTQKDPKEFLPYFEKIKNIDNLVEKKYTICIDLNKYAQAAVELSHGNEEQQERSIQLIQKHNIYNVGVQTFKHNPKQLRRIKNFLGDWLSSKKEYSQSILAYESAQNYEKAMQQAKESLDLQKVLHFAKLLNFTKEQRNKMLEDLLSEARESQHHSYSGQISKKLKQYKQAVQFFIKCEEWKEVVQCLNLITDEEEHQKVKQEIIQSAIQLSANIKGNQIKKLIQTFQQRFNRLKEVQIDKRNTPSLMAQMRQLGGGVLNKDIDEQSDISEHSYITASSRTSYTYSQTTGIKKKKEKSRKSLINRNIAEGSPLEEEYLVAVLKDIQQKQSIFTETKYLIQYLIYFEELEEGHELNRLMLQLEQCTNMKVKSVQQQLFEEQHPEMNIVYPHLDEFKKTDKAYEISLTNFDFIYTDNVAQSAQTKPKIKASGI